MGAEANGPLLSLAQRLRPLGPPSLSVLTARLEEAEEYEAFVALVREFLPEREAEVLRESTPAGQIAAFADFFEDRYFPLQDAFRGMVDSYADLTRGIPVVPLGLTWDDYHDIASDWRPGLQLMTYLLEDPFEEEGARVALAEACAAHVPAELLQRVPQGGLPRETAHRLVDGSPYRGLGLWGDMLVMDTGNYFLDTSVEDILGEVVPWGRQVVEQLTQEWLEAEEMQEAVRGLAEWLEEDPPARFGEVLAYMERGLHDSAQP